MFLLALVQELVDIAAAPLPVLFSLRVPVAGLRYSVWELREWQPRSLPTACTAQVEVRTPDVRSTLFASLAISHRLLRAWKETTAVQTPQDGGRTVGKPRSGGFCFGETRSLRSVVSIVCLFVCLFVQSAPGLATGRGSLKHAPRFASRAEKLPVLMKEVMALIAKHDNVLRSLAATPFIGPVMHFKRSWRIAHSAPVIVTQERISPNLLPVLRLKIKLIVFRRFANEKEMFPPCDNFRQQLANGRGQRSIFVVIVNVEFATHKLALVSEVQKCLRSVSEVFEINLDLSQKYPPPLRGGGTFETEMISGF